ncbi:four helix bundle protein [Luteitalea pratensis]|uniref:four helix bundle protein n=1 Tax=Luteitalea pratensis TaxID=1855912 RepID=UPI0012FFA098|nr:four helix bundle protein [Luteitalea pratensis]
MVGIARKEAREAQFWLRLSRESGVLQTDVWPELLKETEEVSRVVAAIARSAKRSSRRGE